ncbi:hypothetical protein COW36_09335 [bacterium (Candidatus Blackallbacteria) CG17_big_fil_post_rev_8_21_14_2_50_48_46]|uniref:Uncharacterized protein n=1 Tax=bacterium (Candidatus Blackallbacteria) CG17_big_fil_post_rev_8_21_14_2_50_48_46 TaxID=2014261 RepID=A0A2M7G5X7_9BACT|nr:MAG: hypothetical protein COW64_23715 [bacterium (Candidatus Blackallbacteria) CG18_big_fil_WC_8_21_14_2_50_49_26]PIW17368.1 MAG: hypothetical protein COW36_09335 [bacterium (Candidatus Blackallbacteria) CG17_big_fil_post_rev_8_21_14_2_50_48_46]PIW47400.1 MAG: hypothetical protein COW20_12495 [bacterium (Candidatus Blackallbacteria) CG13_big_fil_rev_8_21_14_2_50_49_14]
MSDLRFQTGSMQAFWNARQSGKDPNTLKDDPAAQALGKVFQDQQLTRKEYDQLKTLYLKSNPDGDFETFLADALDGRADGKTLTAFADAVRELSRKGSALSSVSFQNNEQHTGFQSLAAAILQPDKQVLDAVKAADSDGNGRIEGQERAQLKSVLNAQNSQDFSMVAKALDDGMTTLAYDAKQKTLSLFFSERPPALSGRVQDVRFSGELKLEDIDGVNDLSRDDLKGRANGQVQISYPFLSEVIHDALNPNLPNMSGSALGLSGGFRFSLQNEHFDAQRGMYIVNATTTLSAGVSRFSASQDIPVEIQIKHSPEGELQIQIPALDDVSVPGLRAAAWKLRDGLLQRVSSGMERAVDQQSMGVKLHPHVKTIEGTYTNWHLGESRGPVSQRLVLQPSLQLQLKNPLPRSDGKPPADMLLDLQADRSNTQAKVQAKGIQLQLKNVPVAGSSDQKATVSAASQRDRVSDSARVQLEYGLDIDIAKGGKLRHEAVIQEADFNLDVQADEMADFAFVPRTEAVLGKEGKARMQLRGHLEVSPDHQVRGSLNGKISGQSTQGEAFTHFKTHLDTGKTEAQRISLAGTDLKYNPAAGQKGEVHHARLQAQTGEVTRGAAQPVKLELNQAEGQVKIDLKVLQELQDQLKQGNEQLLKTLQSVGLSDETLQKLTKGSRKELRQLLKLDDFLPRLQSAMVRFEAGHWELAIDRQGYQVKGKELHLKAETQETGADQVHAGANLEVSAQSLEGHSLTTPISIKGLQQLQKRLQDAPFLRESIMNRLKIAGLTPEQIAVFESGNAQALEALLRVSDLPERLQAVLSDNEVRLENLSADLKAERADHETGLLAQAHFEAGSLRLDASENLITPELLKTIQARLQPPNREAAELLETLHDAGLSEAQIERLKSGSEQELAELAKDSDFVQKMVFVPARNQLHLSLKDGAAQAQIQATESSGNRLELKAGAAGLSGRHDSPGSSRLKADSLQAEAQYQDGQGNRLHLETVLENSQFRKDARGKYVLEAPQAESVAELRLALKDFNRLVEAVGPVELKRLVEAGQKDDLQGILHSMGLTEAQIARTIAILWQPQVKALLGTSDFVKALENAETLDIRIQANTSARISNPTGQIEVDAKGAGTMHAALKDASGNALVRSEGQAQGLKAGLDASGVQLDIAKISGDTRGLHADGSEFIKLSGSIADFRSHWSEAQKSVGMGAVRADIDASTQLDSESLEKIQDILKNFKDALQERLKSFGLSKQQLENLIRAFGQKQFSQWFSGADREQIQAFAEQFGISTQQLERILDLMHDQSFHQVIEEIYNFSELLDKAELKTHLGVSAGGMDWSDNDKQMVLGLRDLQANLTVDSQNAQGHSSLSVHAEQDQTRRERTKSESHTTWGETRFTVSGDSQDRLGNQISAQGKLSYQPGEVRTQADGSSQLKFGKIEGQLSGKMSGPKLHQADLSVQGGLDSIETSSSSPEDSVLQLANLQTSGSLNIQQGKEKTQLDARVGLEHLTSRPEQLKLDQLQVQGDYQADSSSESLGHQRRDHGSLSAQNRIASIEVGKEGAHIQGTQLSVQAQASLSEDGKTSAHLAGRIQDAKVHDIQAHAGHVKLDQVDGHLMAEVRTPTARTKLSADPHLAGVSAHEGLVTAKDLQIRGIEGDARIRMQKVRELLSASPNALKVLNQVASHFGTRPSELFTNDTLTFKLNQGQLITQPGQEDALRNPKDFSGQLQIPGLQTQLGKADLNLDLKHLSLNPNPDASPRVELSGQARFEPRQPAFNQAINQLLKQQFSAWGLPNLNASVEIKNGEFQVKIDRWFVAGLVKADFEGDRMSIELDRVKLLRFISAKGLITGKVADSLEKNLIDFSQDENRLHLSLNDMTEAILHKDNLQIKRVELAPDNHFEIQFNYEDSQAYNAGARQRQVKKVQERVLQNRSESELEDIVEDMGKSTRQRLFQQASSQQLRKMLEAVGNDYDNVLRETLAQEKDLKNYPLENRAIMAAYLASDKGFLEGVDRQEKDLIKKLVNSLQGRDYQVFAKSLSADELKRINQFAHAELEAAYQRLKAKGT